MSMKPNTTRICLSIECNLKYAEHGSMSISYLEYGYGIFQGRELQPVIVLRDCVEDSKLKS